MKKRSIVLSTIAVSAALVVMFKQPIKEFVYDLVTSDMFVSQDDDNFDPGPKVGTSLPPINALYAGQNINHIGDFAGENGTILVASRSFDWCPYCMKQMIELQQSKSLFDQAGIGLVAMTYDSQELQQQFTSKHDIDIPVLADINGQSFEALGILNADYAPGDDRYGLPYPGMIILNSEGVIVGKLFVEAYSVRVDAKSSLQFALSQLD